MFNQYCPLCNKDLSSFRTKFELLKEKILKPIYNPILYSCYDCEIHFHICNIHSNFKVSSFFTDPNEHEYGYCYSIFKDGRYSFPIWLEQVVQIDAFINIPKRIMELDKDISLQEAAKIIKTYKNNLIFG